MAHKITLTVPDSIYRKIERWRSAFNLSRVFQDAIEEAIERKEEFQKRLAQDVSLADVVRRLRREKLNYEEKAFRRAEEEGRTWAAHAHYEDLVLVVEIPTEEVADNQALRTRAADTIDRLSTNYRRAFRSYEAFCATVCAGWHGGVCAFWSTVEDQL